MAYGEVSQQGHQRVIEAAHQKKGRCFLWVAIIAEFSCDDSSKVDNLVVGLSIAG